MRFATEHDERGAFCRVQMRGGREFLIDPDDIRALGQYEWHPIIPNRRCQGKHTYVHRREGKKFIPRSYTSHRTIQIWYNAGAQ